MLCMYVCMYIYPLANVYKKLWKITMLFMAKSTISTGPFSIAKRGVPLGKVMELADGPRQV